MAHRHGLQLRFSCGYRIWPWLGASCASWPSSGSESLEKWWNWSDIYCMNWWKNDDNQNRPKNRKHPRARELSDALSRGSEINAISNGATHPARRKLRSKMSKKSKCISTVHPVKREFCGMHKRKHDVMICWLMLARCSKECALRCFEESTALGLSRLPVSSGRLSAWYLISTADRSTKHHVMMACLIHMLWWLINICQNGALCNILHTLQAEPSRR